MAPKNQRTVFLPSENHSIQLSIRFSKSQELKINSICKRYKLRKNDFFRQLLDEFVTRHNIK